MLFYKLHINRILSQPTYLLLSENVKQVSILVTSSLCNVHRQVIGPSAGWAPSDQIKFILGNTMQVLNAQTFKIRLGDIIWSYVL